MSWELGLYGATVAITAATTWMTWRVYTTTKEVADGR